MTATIMNVNAVIDQAKFRPFHLMVILWCLFVVLFDGYDLAINGVAFAFNERVGYDRNSSGNVSQYSLSRYDVWDVGR